MWIKLLKTKDQAFEAFKKLKYLAESELGTKVKSLRTDRGGEFTSTSFNEWCENEGIRRYLTAPYTPQQNGVVERRNQTILGTTRSILKAMNMPKYLWGEGVRHSVYLLNRVPTKANDDKTPYEMLKGRKPNLEFLRVFGCLVHVKNPSERLAKLDDRSTLMVHLGMEEGTKAYRCYNPLTEKIVVSRDVKFEENRGWKWGDSDEDELDEFTDEKVADFDAVSVGTAPIQSAENSPMHGSPVSDAFAVQNQHWVEVDSDENQPESQPQNQFENGEESPHTESFASQFHTSNVEDQNEQSLSDTYDDYPVSGFRSLADVYARSETVQQVPFERLLLLLMNEEPTTYHEAKKSTHWKKAMEEEISSIEKNKTWVLVDKPKDVKPIGLKWVYKIKRNESGEVTRFKARLVAKGYAQQYGVDFSDVFAPVTRMETVRLFLALAAQNSWEVHHLDVKTAFLHGELKENIYVEQPEGFRKQGEAKKVYKLKKALYGLRQAPRAWNLKLHNTLRKLGFERCQVEHAVYKRKNRNSVLLVGVYVDDLIITGSSAEDIARFKKQMKAEFEMSDLGLLKYYLGLEVSQGKGKITLKQSNYVTKVLKEGRMWDANPTQYPLDPGVTLSKNEGGSLVDATKYRKLVGCLRYITHTRPDVTYAVGLVSRYMDAPRLAHLQAVKQILRYLRGTVNYGICYSKESNGDLMGYSDSSHASDKNDGRSTTGMIFYFGGGPVAWCSQKQKTVALSSCEAEFMAATATACQAIWLKGVLEHITGRKIGAIKLKVDNKSAIELMKNPVFHGRSKHINVRYHFIRECVEDELVKVEFVSGDKQKADGLTKPLPRLKFIEARKQLQVVDLK